MVEWVAILTHIPESSDSNPGQLEGQPEVFFLYGVSQWSPLWDSGQGSWLQIRGSGLDSRSYQSFWEIVGSLALITDELLEWKVAVPI
jgi:hypothetical protein